MISFRCCLLAVFYTQVFMCIFNKMLLSAKLNIMRLEEFAESQVSDIDIP